MLGRKRWILRPQLGRPAVGIDRGARPPHEVVAGVEGLLGIGGVIAIEADAGRRDPEDDRSAAVEEGIERDEDMFGLVGNVTPAERGLDLTCVSGPHASPDVEGGTVVGEAHFHVVGGPRALLRLLLDEVDNGGRTHPDGFVEPAVHPDRVVLDAGRGGPLPLRWRRRFRAGDRDLPARRRG